MRCLNAGGMEIAYTIQQTNYIALHGYEPTPGGIFETDVTEFRRSDFVQVYDGKVLKIPLYMLEYLPRHAYKLLFMLRDPEAIRRSMFKYAPTNLFPHEELTWMYSRVTDVLMDVIKKRGDIEVLKVQYEIIVDNPYREFEKIKTFGFPVDVGKAAEIVDARLQRNKGE
jgi:hypothetical protein